MSKFAENLAEIKSFVTDPQWQFTLSLDVSLDETLEEELLKLIRKIRKADPSGNDLNGFLVKVRSRCQDELSLSKALNYNPFEVWRKARIAYCFYGFLEAITEGSVFSDKIVSRLAEALGKSYLEKIAAIDKMKPSILTNFESSPEDNNLVQMQEVQDYLILKDWQDNQHLFHEKVLYPWFAQARDQFQLWAEANFPDLVKQEQTSRLIALVSLANEKLLPIEKIERLILGGTENIQSIVGGKAFGLGKLLSLDMEIPKTFVIPVHAVAQGSYDGFLGDLPEGTWAVRSSASVEDGANNSFAGMFESFLDVKTEDLSEYVEKVANSVFSARVKSYVSHFKTEEPKMAIVIQCFKEPEISGVWIGSEIDSGHLEWVTGRGDKLVSGMVTPEAEYWEGGKTEALKSISGLSIGEVALKIQRQLNATADLEWCVVNGTIYLLQLRAVTKAVPRMKKQSNQASLQGIPASPGSFQGKAIVLESPGEIALWEKGSVLVTEYTDPNWIPIMIQAGAVITSEGGFLSHAAIIARELGIPCITGMSNALKEIKSGSRITVNGSIGTVEIV